MGGGTVDTGRGERTVKDHSEEETATARMNLRIKGNQHLREFLAEFLGTFILVLFGDGAVAQWSLAEQTGGNKGGNFLHVCLGYGLALMLGIFVSGGVSGGHLNPAVTLTMAVLKKLRWAQVPVYMGAQYLGAFFACLVLWGNYADIIAMVAQEGDKTSMNTAGIFASYPSYTTEQVAWYSLASDQMLGTALLILIILSVTDQENMKISPSLVPISIGLGLTAIHISFGLTAGAAVNPARDFSPRLFTLMAGWADSFSAADYWFWIPWLLPHVGGVLGGMVYTVMVAAHHPESMN